MFCLLSFACRQTFNKQSGPARRPPQNPCIYIYIYIYICVCISGRARPTAASGPHVRTRGREWVGHLVVRLLSPRRGPERCAPSPLLGCLEATGPRHGNRCDILRFAQDHRLPWRGYAEGTHCVVLRAGAHTPTPTLCVGVVHGFTV